MKKNTTKYWFNLNSETFLWKSNKEVLLYNTSVQKSLTFINNDDLNAIVTKLQDIDNLYCLELSEFEINSDVLNAFIKNSVDSGFGNLQKAKEGEKKPAFFVPVLKLQNKMKKVDHYVKSNDNMLSYLHEIDIYVNEKEDRDLNSSVKPSIITNIPFADLLAFIDSFINISSVNTVNICGENLFKYPSIEQLIEELSQTKVTRIIHLKQEHILDNSECLLLWQSKIAQIKIIVEPGFVPDKIIPVINLVRSEKLSTAWQFNITSEQDYEKAEDIIDSQEIEDYEIIPVYNGSNQNFFEEFIYLTEEDIQSSLLTKREIFAHQALNTNNFGKLIIRADGTVYANLYQPPLGTIKNPINKMLLKELSGNSSWLKIRDMAPCNNCIYKWLCPSPSDYELALGKPDLCHVSSLTK